MVGKKLFTIEICGPNSVFHLIFMVWMLYFNGRPGVIYYNLLKWAGIFIAGFEVCNYFERNAS